MEVRSLTHCFLEKKKVRGLGCTPLEGVGGRAGRKTNPEKKHKPVIEKHDESFGCRGARLFGTFKTQKEVGLEGKGTGRCVLEGSINL